MCAAVPITHWSRAAAAWTALVWLTLASTGCMLFPTEAGESLSHYGGASPEVGKRAPEFRLQDLDGSHVTLNDILGDRPVVIQLGSYTCPVFRYRRFSMRPLRTEYADRVIFLVLYTQEAHPVDRSSPYRPGESPWVPRANRIAGIDVGAHTSLEARVEQARRSKAAMQSNARFLVDDFDNSAWHDYGRAPSAAYVLDSDGRVRLSQPWVEPEGIRAALDVLLDESQ